MNTNKPFEGYFDFNWSNEAIWKLKIPSEGMQTALLVWHLNLPLWSTAKGKGLFNLCPIDVLKNTREYPEHHERILRADLAYPLDIMWTVDGFIILDGIHRLAKASTMGLAEVVVRKIPREYIPQIRKN